MGKDLPDTPQTTRNRLAEEEAEMFFILGIGSVTDDRLSIEEGVPLVRECIRTEASEVSWFDSTNFTIRCFRRLRAAGQNACNPAFVQSQRQPPVPRHRNDGFEFRRPEDETRSDVIEERATAGVIPSKR